MAPVVQKYKRKPDLHARQAGGLSRSAPQRSGARGRGAPLQTTSRVAEAGPNAADERAPPDP